MSMCFPMLKMIIFKMIIFAPNVKAKCNFLALCPFVTISEYRSNWLQETVWLFTFVSLLWSSCSNLRCVSTTALPSTTGLQVSSFDYIYKVTNT